MKALFELFRRFDARRIFGFIRRLGGMSRPKVKRYDLRSTRALWVEGGIKGFRKKVIVYQISIHALRVEGDEADLLGHLLGDISIHALRVEGDDVVQQILSAANISIHALRVEGDIIEKTICHQQGEFLSTPSGWRATAEIARQVHELDISIHALRVEGDKQWAEKEKGQIISIHALRVEGDHLRRDPVPRIAIFLSTPSGWRATAADG